MTPTPPPRVPNWVEAHAARHAQNAWDGLDLSALQGASSDTRPYLPMSLVALSYSPLWGQLRPEEQLRLNHLTGMASIELVGQFEATLVIPVVDALRKKENDPRVRACLERFIADERIHINAWTRMNQASDPTLYAENPHALMGAPGTMAQVTRRWATARPWHFPAMVWLMLANEERFHWMAHQVAQDPAVHPTWKQAYLLHLADELRHVEMDQHLLAPLWARQNPLLMKLNARLLTHLVRRHFCALQKGGVADHTACRLALEFPRLQPMLPQLRLALRTLHGQPDFRASLFSSQTIPTAIDWLGRMPGMQPLARELSEKVP